MISFAHNSEIASLKHSPSLKKHLEGIDYLILLQPYD